MHPRRSRPVSSQCVRGPPRLSRWCPAHHRWRLLGGSVRWKPVGGRISRRVRTLFRRIHVASRLRSGHARHRTTFSWLPRRHWQPSRDNALQLPTHGQPFVLRQHRRCTRMQSTLQVTVVIFAASNHNTVLLRYLLEWHSNIISVTYCKPLVGQYFKKYYRTPTKLHYNNQK